MFRYTGPRPQFREAALVMLADAVEAASRAMPEPTTERLQALVQRIITAVFSEGQLDECDLTLRDLNAIAPVVPAHPGGHLPLAAGVPARSVRGCAPAGPGPRHRDADGPAAVVISDRDRRVVTQGPSSENVSPR